MNDTDRCTDCGHFPGCDCPHFCESFEDAEAAQEEARRDRRLGA